MQRVVLGEDGGWFSNAHRWTRRTMTRFSTTRRPLVGRCWVLGHSSICVMLAVAPDFVAADWFKRVFGFEEGAIDRNSERHEDIRKKFTLKSVDVEDIVGTYKSHKKEGVVEETGLRDENAKSATGAYTLVDILSFLVPAPVHMLRALMIVDKFRAVDIAPSKKYHRKSASFAAVKVQVSIPRAHDHPVSSRGHLPLPRNSRVSCEAGCGFSLFQSRLRSEDCDAVLPIDVRRK